jgi:hypothetical protein
MSCCNLNVTNDVFGLPIIQSIVGQPAKRGEWVGLTLALKVGGGFVYATTPQTYNVAGLSAVVDPPVGGLVTVAVSGRTFALPWRPSIPGATNLLAARFVNTDFMVFRDADSTNGQWTFRVLDLRNGTSCSGLSALGPFTVPATFDLLFCPSSNGELAMVWNGTTPAQVTGRKAYLVRTMVDTTRLAPLLVVDDLAAGGKLGCEISATARTAVIFDQANTVNNVIARGTNSRNLFSDSLPLPGKLKLSLQSITINGTSNTNSLTIENAGRDFLEVSSASSSNAAVIPSFGGPAPVCLWPGETLPLIVTRASSAATSATVTVVTSPASSPAAESKVTVTLQATTMEPPRPAASVVPVGLGWRTGQSQTQRVSVKNTGNVDLDLRVDGPPGGSGFMWMAVATRVLAAGATVGIDVRPVTTGPDAGQLVVGVFGQGTVTALPGFPKDVGLVKNTMAKVPVGALRITALVANPFGSDVAIEGEFLELVNTSGGVLDLTGCSVTHEVLPASGTPRQRQLARFGPQAFGSDAMLASQSTAPKPLRVLTRAKAATDPATDPLRFYCGLRAPVWNNTGDTARILNEDGAVVAIWSYATVLPSSGSLPSGTVYSPPPSRQRVATRRVFVNASMDWNTVFNNVEDGDALIVRDVTGRVSLGGFLGLAGDSGPEGRVGDPAGSSYPVPGAPRFCLIALVGVPENDGSVTPVSGPFFVGAAGTVTVNVPNPPTRPLSFFLGVNDDLVGDNSGSFDCAVDLTR